MTVYLCQPKIVINSICDGFTCNTNSCVSFDLRHLICVSLKPSLEVSIGSGWPGRPDFCGLKVQLGPPSSNIKGQFGLDKVFDVHGLTAWPDRLTQDHNS